MLGSVSNRLPSPFFTRSHHVLCHLFQANSSPVCTGSGRLGVRHPAMLGILESERRTSCSPRSEVSRSAPCYCSRASTACQRNQPSNSVVKSMSKRSSATRRTRPKRSSRLMPNKASKRPPTSLGRPVSRPGSSGRPSSYWRRGHWAIRC